MVTLSLCFALALCAVSHIGGTSVRKPFPTELSSQPQFDNPLETQYFDETGQLVNRDLLEKRGIWRGELYRRPQLKSYRNRLRFASTDWKRSGWPAVDNALEEGRVKKTIWRNRLYMTPTTKYRTYKRIPLRVDYDDDDVPLYSYYG